jgi:phosphatidate cytidylyltransferase
MSDLGRRVGTALVLIPLAVGAVLLGGWGFALFLVLVAGVAQAELYGLCEAAGLAPMRPLGLAAGALVVLAPLWPPALALATLAALALVAAELYRRHETPLGNAAAGVLGLVYPAALVAWMVHLRVAAAPALGEGAAAWLTLTVFVAVWAADSFAYFTGRAIGRRPLFPRVSPKKTVEGTVGGALGAVLPFAVLKLSALPVLGWADVVALGVIVGTLGPFGDLTASLFKRAVGAKDSGKLLPGHGGVLDRIDAMLFAIPGAAFYLQFVARVF